MGALGNRRAEIFSPRKCSFLPYILPAHPCLIPHSEPRQSKTIHLPRYLYGRRKIIVYVKYEKVLAYMRDSNQRPRGLRKLIQHPRPLGHRTDMHLKLLQYHHMWFKEHTFDKACIQYIVVRGVLELTVRQNLHFSYQCRYYIYFYCMYTSNHNQFDT